MRVKARLTSLTDNLKAVLVVIASASIPDPLDPSYYVAFRSRTRHLISQIRYVILNLSLLLTMLPLCNLGL